MAGPASDWQSHSLYGITLKSEFRFKTALPANAAPHALTFICTREPPEIAGPPVDPVYQIPSQIAGKSPLLTITPFPDRAGSGGIRIRFTGVAEYYIQDRSILCHLLDPAYAYLIELQLLGHVLALWLEREGMPALHASAVVVDEVTLVFLASNKGGKSSLAASLLEAGFPLLSDDILPLETQASQVVGRSGYPRMRLWPEQARHFVGHFEGLEIVHPAYTKRWVPVGEAGFGRFHEGPAPIGCIFLPDMVEPAHDTVITVEPVQPREAFKQLIGNSFVGEMVEALGWQPRRLPALARLASTTPTYRLRYPKALDRLPDVREAILSVSSEIKR